MYRRSPLSAALLVAVVLALLLTSIPPAAAEKEGPADPPHDLIVAVDVSGSMVVVANKGKGNDPQGMRLGRSPLSD